MNKPSQILSDKGFWLRLEFNLSKLLEASEDKSLRQFWCDGFLPDVVNATNQGEKIEGVVWIGNHDRNQRQFRFIVLIAQDLLKDITKSFSIERIHLDEKSQVLELSIV
jgi:hypothetical protein